MSDYDPSDLAGQERQKAEIASREKRLDESEEADLKWLMNSRRGRRYLWRLLGQAKVFHLSFNTNAMQMAFNEGRRNFGNRTLELIHLICPELYPAMIKENTSGERNADDGPSRNDP